MSKISKHFSKIEMQCKCKNCGNSCPMDTVFMTLLDKVREECDAPLNVSSGFRCDRHNKDIGGVENSWHTKGKAADIWTTAIPLKQVFDIAKKYFEEVILYEDKGFVHIAEPKAVFYTNKTDLFKETINKVISILQKLVQDN
jgi:uncharacterized protein YcbK (DUF882 family)